MAVVWRLGLILFGFALATLVAALSHAPSAHAAEEADAYETPHRLRGSVSDSLYDLDTDPADEALSGTDSFSEPDGTEAGEPAQPLDGGSTADGLVDLAEPEAPEDGADPLRDARPPADLDAFLNPPAGYDPLLFQVEDVAPVSTDRRPARLARFEPYDPIGVRIGSFVFFPEVEIGGLATDNVFATPDAHADVAAEMRAAGRLVSNWSAHALELSGTRFRTFHDDFPSEDDRAWSVEARGRLDITRRTNLQAIAGRDVSQESRSAIDASQTGERADVTTDRAELALNHRFNRLSVRLRGGGGDSRYSPTDGVSNADRDTRERIGAVRAAWEFKPTLALFAEQEWNRRDKRALPADGIARDSDGTRTRAGLDFGSTGAVLRGTISVGYGRQAPDDGRLSDVAAVLFDANLAWRPSEITSFLLTASTDIYETTTVESGGVVAHTAGLEARHALRRHLIASAGLAYTHYDYDATPFTERQWLAFAGLEYYASPWLVLFARYQHLDFASNGIDADYESDEVRAGLRLRR